MTQKKRLYGVYGASGFGREVMPLARMELEKSRVDDATLVFIDDGELPKNINGQSIVTFAQFLAIEADERYAVVAIADSRTRERITNQMTMNGVNSWSIQAASSSILDFVKLGEGAVLCNNVTLTSNIDVGVSFHANLNAYVGHDCKIGNYVTFAPSVCCNGNVVIDDHVYVGTGAIIKQGTPGNPLIIGKGSIIGMGAVVTKSVEPGSVVVGNPARPLIKQ